MPRHVRFGAILGEVLTEIFKKKIAPNFAPDVLQRLTDRPRFVNLPQHHAAREIRCDSRRLSDRNFRKSSAAATFWVRDRAEIRSSPRAAACARASEVPSHCAERPRAAAREIRCDSRRNSDRNFRNFFAAAKFCDRNRARSRRNPLSRTCCSLATSLRGPQTLCRASECRDT